MQPTFSHEPDRSRYVATLNGDVVGEADYTRSSAGVAIVHTGVRPDLRRQGIAGGLVRFALDDLRTATQERVIAACPYVAHWIGAHPDYADLTRR